MTTQTEDDFAARLEVKRKRQPVVQMNALQSELLAAVVKHAHANYDKGGWDFIVETMTDEDVVREIGRCSTPAGAIAKLGILASLWDEQRRAVKNA